MCEIFLFSQWMMLGSCVDLRIPWKKKIFPFSPKSPCPSSGIRFSISFLSAACLLPEHRYQSHRMLNLEEDHKIYWIQSLYFTAKQGKVKLLSPESHSYLVAKSTVKLESLVSQSRAFSSTKNLKLSFPHGNILCQKLDLSVSPRLNRW